MRLFIKIQDWILKSEIIRKRILRFFTQQINPRSFGSRCLKGAEESTPRVDSSVPLIHHNPRDLGLICLVKKRKIRFRILSDLRIQSWNFLNKRTLSYLPIHNLSHPCSFPVNSASQASGIAIPDKCSDRPNLCRAVVVTLIRLNQARKQISSLL